MSDANGCGGGCFGFVRVGISRDSMHKRRATGGKQKAWRKKRKYRLSPSPALSFGFVWVAKVCRLVNWLMRSVV